MIDTHAHWSEGWDITGLKAVVLAASSVEDSKRNIKLAKASKIYKAAVGIHPQEHGDIGVLEKLIDNQVAAIGECGLDFFGDYDAKKQELLFRDQIKLAQKHDLPLIVHSRKSMDEVLGILAEHKNLRGTIHCYTGGKKRINKVLGLGENWYFGFDGNLTYEIGLVDVVKCIPRDKVLLETDSPFLAPVPHRGETNCPANVRYIYDYLSDLWGEDAEKIVDENAKKLFQIIL